MSKLHIGDRVKVIGHSMRLAGRIGVIHDQRDDGRLCVAFDDGDHASFIPSDLEKVILHLEGD